MPRSWVVERVPRLWVWWAASRPSQLALVGLLYVLGVGMATVGPPLVAGDVAATDRSAVGATLRSARVLAGAGALLPVAAAVHYANEYADVDTDARTQRTPFSGGSGALVATGLPRSVLRVGFAVACVAAVAVSLAGVATEVLSVGAVALLSVLLAAGLAYSLPPFSLVRRGVGELVNALLGGVFVPMYGVAVVARPRAAAALAVVPFTLLVGCNLLATHWPDRRADEAVGKRTLAVRWEPRHIRRAYALLAVAAAATTVGLWQASVLPDAAALAHIAPVPFLVWGWKTLTRRRSPLPAVAAMVALAVAATVAWWWVALQ